jgi:hypothetical protein
LGRIERGEKFFGRRGHLGGGGEGGKRRNGEDSDGDGKEATRGEAHGRRVWELARRGKA